MNEENMTINDDFNNDDNLELILQMVQEAGVDSLTPEELETYVEFARENETPERERWHYENLAEHVDEGVLNNLASEIINWVNWDEESREDWSRREAKGIKLLGVSDETEGGADFEGASRVVHPLIMEGIVQFQSRAIAELWPKSGPVKTVIAGESSPELIEKSRRVEKYANHLYTQGMPGAFEEMDQLLFRLPMSGSCFKKMYYDPINEVVCSRLVEPSDFIVPYSATDLQSSARYTHRIRENRNDIQKKIKLGFYRDIHITKNSQGIDDDDYPDVREQIDRAEGVSRTDHDGDSRNVIYEMYVDYDLKGFEDVDGDGEPTGIALPYIITVSKNEQRILRIQRNWKEEGAKKKKKLNFTHYKFTPGFGFYGFGLLHLIGGLGNAATGAVRALLDSAQYENMQGGFLSEDARIESDDKPIAPGEWRRTKSTAEELSKSFFPLPRSQPSGTLFNLLGYLDEKGQRLSSTTDAMVGSAPANMAVGTAMQNIENGTKVFSAIHRRLHEAQTKEFKIIIDLVRDYIPETGYPYAIDGVSGTVMHDDFADEINIIPVSDPNLISQSHRISQAQGVLQLAMETGEINKTVATKMMLEAMRVSNIDELMQKEQPGQADIEAMQLEMDKMRAEIDLKAANADKVRAQATGDKLKSQYTAMQSAQVAVSVPDTLPVADDLLASAGYDDADGSPIADQSITGQPIADQSEQDGVEIEQNTDPRFPAHPDSPGEGVNHGIETMENDGVSDD